MHFEEAGEGFPVVLIHGFCETNYIWNRFRKDLSDEFRVICPDLPGFGQTPLCPTPFQLTDIADQLNEWLHSMGIDRCVTIGHSLGGYITLELARRHPERLKGFGLFNSSAFSDPPEKKENRDKLIQFIKKEGVQPFIKTFVPSLFYHPTASQFEEEISRLKELGSETSPEAVIAYTAAMRDRKDNLDLIKQNGENVLLISGEEDQNVPVELSRKMAKWLLPENVYILEGSAHMSMFEKKDVTITAIRKFASKMRNRNG